LYVFVVLMFIYIFTCVNSAFH